MRVYISGAITGNDNCAQEFSRAEHELRSKGWQVVNPATTLSHLPGLEHEEYMAICEKMLHACDAMYLVPRWEESQGARQEIDWALEDDIVIMQELFPPEYVLGVIEGKLKHRELERRAEAKKKSWLAQFIGKWKELFTDEAV